MHEHNSSKPCKPRPPRPSRHEFRFSSDTLFFRQQLDVGPAVDEFGRGLRPAQCSITRLRSSGSDGPLTNKAWQNLLRRQGAPAAVDTILVSRIARASCAAECRSCCRQGRRTSGTGDSALSRNLQLFAAANLLCLVLRRVWELAKAPALAVPPPRHGEQRPKKTHFVVLGGTTAQHV